EINGKLIYKLFNFFIRLTKELHLCHVFALSSDSLFIERVYNEAMLEGRTNYILIDDFDEENAGKFLKKYKFKDINKAIKYFGGKPGDLRILLEEGKEINSVVQEKIAEKRRLISDILDKLLYVKPKIEMEEGEEKIPVERDKIIEILKMFKDKEEIRDTGISRAEKIYLSRKNILFINPQKETIKTQSGIILTGIREILKEIDDNTLTIK
ncbi:MAG: ATP-binding protein, partial [Candidatus Altiarchaeales archaeon HGW-Altiarchaeales-2]